MGAGTRHFRTRVHPRTHQPDGDGGGGRVSRLGPSGGAPRGRRAPPLARSAHRVALARTARRAARARAPHARRAHAAHAARARAVRRARAALAGGRLVARADGRLLPHDAVQSARLSARAPLLAAHLLPPLPAEAPCVRL